MANLAAPSAEGLEHPYLKKGLIAYLGNKRSLLSFLAPLFQKYQDGRSPIFLDPFCGTSAVSRLARYLGFSVRANDWEPYAQILAEAALCASPHLKLFANRGGIEVVFQRLNSLYGQKAAEPYVSRYYAPACLESADLKTERLFYTPANAAFIDNARCAIEEMYCGEQEGQSRLEKSFLLASLLYEASRRSNTSGVFKAFHKGYGGLGGDALNRIMGPISLEPLPLINRPPGFVHGQDAAAFCRQTSGNLCYLDPPYNTHQYGSNYFMLNAIALWNKPPVSNELDAKGRLKKKAGIGEAWKKNRSPYCSLKTAFNAFGQLIDSIDAQTILLSYSTEGIISFEQLLDTLESQGATKAYAQNYVTYRGGKQSPQRFNHNVEFVLVCQRGSKTSSRARKQIARIQAEREFANLFKKKYAPERLEELFERQGCSLFLHEGLSAQCKNGYRFTALRGSIQNLSLAELKKLNEQLALCQLRNTDEEITALSALIAKQTGAKGQLFNDLAKALKRYAFKKYAAAFRYHASQIKQRAASQPAAWHGFMEKLAKVEALASLRFSS